MIDMAALTWLDRQRHMKHEDFSIGTEFLTDTGRWRCTDVGTRVIVAIRISKATIAARADDGTAKAPKKTPPDPSWLNGPPYALAEQVFDEDDIADCRKP